MYLIDVLQVQREGSFRELKNSSLIYTAIIDAVRAVDHINKSLLSQQEISKNKP